MSTILKFTSADLAAMPDNGKRYELIDGELFVSNPFHWNHQRVCGRLACLLDKWNDSSGLGVVNIAPGLIFSECDDVVPDVVWISKEKLATALGADGKLHAAPELVVEVLSPGTPNAYRDRETKRKLYSRRGVFEYWLIDWQQHSVEVYRREATALAQVATLYCQDNLETPLLPGFSCRVETLFVA